GVQRGKEGRRWATGGGGPPGGGGGRGESPRGPVMPAGSASGPWLALAGHHRDRRGPGAGRLRCPRPPGRGPERDRGHRQQDEGQRNVRRHQVLHGAPPRLPAAMAAVVPWFLGPCASALTAP